MPKERLFVDTNVIIEAFRVGCWSALCSRFAVETVDKCVEEALSGDTSSPNYVAVDPAQLTSGLTVRHAVTPAFRASLATDDPASAGLDDGERHLLAFLKYSSIQDVFIATADKAAIVAFAGHGLLDAVVALEKLAAASGVSNAQLTALKPHFTSKWLSEVKTSVLLGMD